MGCAKKTLIISLSAVIILLYAYKLAPHEIEKTSLNLTETKFTAVAEDGYKVVGVIVFSPEGMSAAYVAQKGNKQFVVVSSKTGDKIADKKGRAYDQVSEIVFSPDSRRVAYAARKGEKMFVVVDGKEGKPYDSAASLVFSPDSSMVAYEAKKQGKWFIVINDKESRGCDMHYMPPIFSSDSKLATYIEQHYEKGKTVRVVSSIDMKDRKIGKEYDWIGSVAFSPDGSQVAYAAGRKEKFFVVSGGFAGGDEKESLAYDIPPGHIAFSPDSRKLAYFAEKGEKYFLVVDGKETGLKYPMDYPPVFSPDGSKFALVLRDEAGMQFVSLENKSYPVYEGISRPVFNTDGTAAAYAARQGNEWHLVVDDKRGSAFDMAVTPVFSPDGSRIAYRARKNEKRFIVIADNKANTIKELSAYDMVWQPVFTPDGKSIAYGVKDGQELWWKVETVN